eukprot:scaffold1448_cov387-Prasinococcus_capsulatus_cf.AAC.5
MLVGTPPPGQPTGRQGPGWQDPPKPQPAQRDGPAVASPTAPTHLYLAAAEAWPGGQASSPARAPRSPSLSHGGWGRRQRGMHTLAPRLLRVPAAQVALGRQGGMGAANVIAPSYRHAASR